MAYCRNCGQNIDTAAICPYCGTAQAATPQPAAPAPAPVDDNGGFGWWLLGCCIPIVGLILFLVWKDTKPKTSKAAGVGALVSVIVCVVFYLLMFIGGIGMGILEAGLY